MEEYELMKQPKYRGYMSNIDKALKNFEYSSEWADLISALGKLNKVISSYPQYQIIPRRIKISKRLAQCMHPALPSGVHLKALETYDIIFSNTGVERLASELFIYSAGLFPLLGYAAMNVRPTLLGIYEKYFVPLGERLRPALSGFLSGVLPGYESGLDHFERTNSLLGQVCQAVNPIYFYTCLWECVATNASIRLPAVSYLIDHFNKRSGMDDQKYVIGKNKEVMMSGLCACLNDSLILVQRNTLEFLLLGFPMHTDLINNSDLTKLVTNGLNTILRRDMSLNRRLYAWLLGTEVSNKLNNDAGSSSTGKTAESDSYFNKYSKVVLIKALRNTLKTSLMTSPVDLSPYRILVSLLDKVEIGPVVLDDVLCDVIRTMSLSSTNIEVGKSANLLFATFDPAYIWNFMTQLYEKSCKSSSDTSSTVKPITNSQPTKFLPEVDSGIPSLIEVCYLTEFLLETISLEMYNETTRVYLPKVFLSITQMLTVYLETLKNDEIAASLKLCMKIVERVQPMVSYNSINIIEKSGIGNNSNINKSNRDSTKSTNSIIAPNLENSLEKSKSDSKLNQTILLENENDEPIKRSNSNQSMTKESKNKNKKANNKKSKSYSRLLELNKDQTTNDTGQLMFNSDSAIFTPNLEVNVNTHNNNNNSSSSSNNNNNNNKKSAKSANIKQKSPKSSKGNKINRLDEKIFDELNCDQLENDGSVSLDTESGNTSTPESSLIMRHDGIHHQHHHPFNDSSTSLQEYSILEKCIKQYEIFYQVFISQKILNINNSNDSGTVNNSTSKLPTINLIIENFDQQRNLADSIITDTNQNRLNEINNLFDTLKIKLNCHQKKLYSLLNQTINSFSDETDNSSDSTECNDDEDCDISINQQVSRLLELKLSDQLREAVKLASNLLVDMSTFPSYNQNLVIDYTECEIPCWLKVLSIVACYVKTDKELQISTISTLFELVSILKSQMEHSTNPGVTFVVMLPLLKFGYVNFIETKTRIFQVLTSTLWDYLGDKNTDLQQISSLLYQLNNCLDSGLVETIIGHRIACSHVEWDSINANIQSSSIKDQFNYVNLEDSIMGNYQNRLTDYTRDRLYDVKIMCLPDASQLRAIKNDFINENQFIGFKKFELLWHLGRDLGQNTKSFDKTLLKMFDKLSLPYYSSIRIFVTKWLQESLIRGDLSRVIRPLLKIMLAPNTKKISILHAQTLRKADQQSNNELTDKVDNENNDDDAVLGKDIYAVRNDDGNVSYHIETPPSKKRSSPIRSLQKKFFGVTIGGSKTKSSNFMNTDKTSTTSFSSIETQIGNTNNISLIINPLDNSSDLEPPIDPIQDREYSDSIEDQPKGISFKEDFYSSADDDVSLTSSNDTDSIRSDPYLSSTSTIDDNNLKRYAGNFNEVSEILSEHDRTKNKKTYHLNHKLNQSENDVSIGGNNVNNSFDESIPADEFFNNSSSSATELVIENVVNDLIMEAVEKIDSDDQIQQQHVYQTKRFSKQKPINKSVKIRNKTKIKTDKKSRHSTGNIADTRGAVLCNSPESSKRLSYTSKISTISSSSNNSSNLSDSKDSDNDVKDSDNENSNIDVSKIVSNLESNEKMMESSNAMTTPAMNNSSASESIKKVIADAKKINWEKAQEVFDKVKRNVDILRKNSERDFSDDKLRNEKVDQFHSHMLLYLGVYDTNQVLYAFQTLRNIISCNCRTFLCLSVTTAVSNSQIKQLLIRHKKSISGKGFTGTIINTEFSHAYRGCMYLEALVTICLYYARGYFQKESLTNDVYDVPTTDDIHGNHKIQMASIELLTLLCTELITIIKDKKLACYIADLMVKCKLQKIILHCVLLSVHSLNKSNGPTYSEQILRFNDPGNERLYSESLQIQLLRLLLSVIKLEYEVNVQKTDEAQQKSFTAVETNPSSYSPTRPTPSTPNNVKYLPNCLISQQPMFLSAILQALQSDTLKHLHRNWTDLVTSSLNCLNFGSLTNIVISVVHQICTNIDKIVKGGKSATHPPDYTVSQLEALTVLCHFCLLDNTQQTSLTQIFNQSYPQMNSSASNSNSSQLFNTLVNGILSTNSNENQTRNAQHMAARNAVLSHLPRIVASVAALWENEIGQQQNVKHQLLEFLSPISLHHGVNFLTAVAVAWQERGEAKKLSTTLNINVSANNSSGRKNSIPANLTQSHKALPQATPEQMILVRLVSGIRVMPMDSFVQTLHQVVKSPPPIHHPPAGLILEVSALELFYFYMKGAPAPQLSDSWCSLLALLRDGLNLSPPAQFVMLTILNEFVQRCPQMPFQDKKDLRDLHDTTSRLVEALSTIAGACLEQTTWLRRNLAVKEDLNGPVHGDGNIREGGNTVIIGNHQYSVQAQSVLAVVLANLLDVAYGSQEKDKVITIVTTLMYNIIPYLKNHTARNIPSFYACSHLLASLSGYQYTRKAWRKDLLDLLLDSTFFQMDLTCLPFWKSILDSLMTYDNTTFRELMNRVSLAQTGGLNIFTSKEQEYEQRALLLKRLAFVIFCSELDQYHKYMPEIQEQLANSLRLPQVVPSVQAAVFLCFRVLLLRMTPDNVTSLWPIIIAEMVQVFLAIEQELMTDTEEYSQHIKMLSGLDTSWVTNTSNGLHSQGHPHWRMVQLETAKLLEMGCVLPATILPHFQMYRWAFVGGKYDNDSHTNTLPKGNQSHQTVFVPHVTRISRLMDCRYKDSSPQKQSIQDSKTKSGYLVLKCQNITNLLDLYPFFSIVGQSWAINSGTIEKDLKNCLEEIEAVLSCDFLEKMPSNLNSR